MHMSWPKLHVSIRKCKHCYKINKVLQELHARLSMDIRSLPAAPPHVYLETNKSQTKARGEESARVYMLRTSNRSSYSPSIFGRPFRFRK